LISDEILEEVRIYREHYCESVLLNAPSPEKVLRRLANLTNSRFLKDLAYSPRGKAYSSILEPEALMLLAAFSVAAVSISLSKYISIENESIAGTA
jgi:hypothetical protein